MDDLTHLSINPKISAFHLHGTMCEIAHTSDWQHTQAYSLNKALVTQCE
jgi:hypothetical protein